MKQVKAKVQTAKIKPENQRYCRMKNPVHFTISISCPLYIHTFSNLHIYIYTIYSISFFFFGIFGRYASPCHRFSSVQQCSFIFNLYIYIKSCVQYCVRISLLPYFRYFLHTCLEARKPDTKFSRVYHTTMMKSKEKHILYDLLMTTRPSDIVFYFSTYIKEKPFNNQIQIIANLFFFFSLMIFNYCFRLSFKGQIFY